MSYRMLKVFNLYLVRHGETNENKNGIIQGHLDSVLNEKGNEQAKLLGKRLANQKFTHVFSSDLQRAMKTCEEMVQQNAFKSSYSVVQDARLRERSLGVIEGKSIVLLENMATELGVKERLVTPEGGEGAEEIQERAKSFFEYLSSEILHKRVPLNSSITQEKLLDQPSSDDILVATHGGFIREFTIYLWKHCNCSFPTEGTPNSVYNSPPNCSITKFKMAVTKGSNCPVVICTMYRDNSHIILNDSTL